MPEIARPNAGETALIERNLSPERQRQVARTSGDIASWTAPQLHAVGLAMVDAVAAPVPAWGSRVDEDIAGERIAEGHWQQKWDVTQDGTLAELKSRGKARVAASFDQKLDALVENKGQGEVIINLLKFTELNAWNAAGQPAEPANYPMLDSHRRQHSLAPQDVEADIVSQRKTWSTLAAGLNDGRVQAIQDIDAAIDAAGIKAAIDVFEAL